MSAARDDQQQRVYKWEAEWRDWNAPALSLTELREIIRNATRRYGARMPAVKLHDSGGYAFSLTPPDGKRPVISFNETGKNKATALHETAHQIADSVFEEGSVKAHGPEWLGIYMALLADYKVAPESALYASANTYRLKWLPYEKCTPRALRELKRRLAAS